MGARETATDEAPAEAPAVTAEAPVDTVMVVVATPAPSLLQDGVPPEWVTLSDQLRIRHSDSSFVIVNVPATEEEVAIAQSNSNPKLKFLCFDCDSGKLIATGGGIKKGCSAANFEASHLKGSRHKRAAGELARYDTIVATEPSQGKPEYGFVRELDLRRRGHFAGICASN